MFDERRSERIGAVAIGLTLAAMVAVLTVDCGGLRPAIDVTVYFAHPIHGFPLPPDAVGGFMRLTGGLR